jgi:hypothetical protein
MNHHSNQQYMQSRDTGNIGHKRKNEEKKPERTTDHGQATGKLYHLRLRVECTLFVIYKSGREPIYCKKLVQVIFKSRFSELSGQSIERET